LKNADFRAKPKEKLDSEILLLFNGCVLSLVENNIVLHQKGQGKKINLVEATEALKSKQGYTEQRARGAYIATICQPEASFDLSVAAQQQDPKIEDIQRLNKRLAWQMEHLDRGLTYIPIDLSTAKLFVFVDGSFANNKDLSS
jgi:hypothetical protein